MSLMKTATRFTRASCAAFLALLIAVRLLAPAGFMPSFESGAVAIVVCPDADSGATPPPAHRHGHSAKLHQPCPYAAGSGSAWLNADIAGIALVFMFVAALLLGAPIVCARLSRPFERPPSRGPPLPA